MTLIDILKLMIQKIKEKIVNAINSKSWILPTIAGIGMMTAFSAVAFLIGSIDNASAMVKLHDSGNPWPNCDWNADC